MGGSFYSWSTTQSQSDISYDASLKLHTFKALIDFFPRGRGSFHVTSGLVTNPLTISAVGVPAASDTFKINGHKYSAAQVGTLTGAGEFKGALPYLGFGWGTPASSGRAVKFMFDLGAALGKPQVTLSATGAASNSQLATDLQAQETKTQHDVRKFFKAYPVLDFGLGTGFDEAGGYFRKNRAASARPVVTQKANIQRSSSLFSSARFVRSSAMR